MTRGLDEFDLATLYWRACLAAKFFSILAITYAPASSYPSRDYGIKYAFSERYPFLRKLIFGASLSTLSLGIS